MIRVRKALPDEVAVACRRPNPAERGMHSKNDARFQNNNDALQHKGYERLEERLRPTNVEKGLKVHESQRLSYEIHQA